jgi:hypothetical protein
METSIYQVNVPRRRKAELGFIDRKAENIVRNIWSEKLAGRHALLDILEESWRRHITPPNG